MHLRPYPRTRLPEPQEQTRLSASLPSILLCREHFDSALVRGPIMQMNKMIRILDHPVRADHEVFTKYIGYRTPLEGNPFQRRDHLALSSLRFAQDDNPCSASFDSQNVFFEMDCPLRADNGFSQNTSETERSTQGRSIGDVHDKSAPTG